jgi:phage terminase small subunit
MKMTDKQKAFCDYYIETLNATEAAKRAGYSQKTAYSTGSENLKKPEILAYIQHQLKIIEDNRIAGAAEVLQYLTKVMRGQEKDQFDLDAPLTERTRAAELLGKRHALWVDKKEIKTNIETTSKLDKIIDQLSAPDEEISEDDL